MNFALNVKSSAVVVAAVIGLSLGTPVNATTIGAFDVTVAGSGAGSNFNSVPTSLNAGAFTIGNWSFSTTTPTVQVDNGNVGSTGAQPFGTTGNYLSVLGNAVETVTFASPLTSFSFLWGSIDPTNALTIDFGAGNTQTFTGTTLAAAFPGVVSDTSCQTATCTSFFTFAGTDITGFSM